jgi:hypothetical protein
MPETRRDDTDRRHLDSPLADATVYTISTSSATHRMHVLGLELEAQSGLEAPDDSET